MKLYAIWFKCGSCGTDDGRTTCILYLILVEKGKAYMYFLYNLCGMVTEYIQIDYDEERKDKVSSV